MCDLFGFFLYFLMLFSLHVSLSIKRMTLLFLSMLFAIIIAAFRGFSGVDSYMYVMRFDGANNFEDISIIEPLIPLMMWIVKFFDGSFSMFSLLYGSVLIGLYMYIFKKIPNSIYFGLTAFPVIFIDSLFNGIRVGLVYPLIFLAVVYSSRVLFILGFFSHVSALIAGVFKIIPFKIFVVITIITIVYLYASQITILELLSERYASKFANYQEMYTKNIYSGIADSMLFFVSILIYLRTIGLKSKQFILTSTYAFIGVIIFHILFVSEYIFMLRIVRLLDIIMFALIAKSTSKLDKRALYIALIFGVLYSLNFLRQINSTCSYEIGGFLPLNFGLL